MYVFSLCVETGGAPRFLRSATGIAHPLFTRDARGSAFAALTSSCSDCLEVFNNLERTRSTFAPDSFQILTKVWKNACVQVPKF